MKAQEHRVHSSRLPTSFLHDGRGSGLNRSSKYLNRSVSTMDRRAFLTKMRKIRETLKPKMVALLKEQEAIMTIDGWISQIAHIYRRRMRS